MHGSISYIAGRCYCCCRIYSYQQQSWSWSDCFDVWWSFFFLVQAYAETLTSDDNCGSMEAEHSTGLGENVFVCSNPMGDRTQCFTPEAAMAYFCEFSLCSRARGTAPHPNIKDFFFLNLLLVVMHERKWCTGNGKWETACSREACEEYCWFTEGYSVYFGMFTNWARSENEISVSSSIYSMSGRAPWPDVVGITTSKCFNNSRDTPLVCTINRYRYRVLYFQCFIFFSSEEQCFWWLTKWLTESMYFLKWWASQGRKQGATITGDHSK